MKEDPILHELPICTMLAGFKKDNRHALSTYGEFLVFKADEIIIQEKEEQDCLYFVVSGLIHALHKMKKGATPLGTIQEGEWFGEINIFDPRMSSAMVVARTESHIWRISRSKLEEFLNGNPSLGCQLLLSIAEVLAHRARELVNKVNAVWELS
ncbi:MAG: cyclic nucleotide-binding domain-containing protein [Kiritimatiellae bacterium]|nr:cyclic nucleotide-binding domain-containing protein [Kiritimatiellia bacterium]